MKRSEIVCKSIIIIASFAATALCAMPMMSTFLSDGENCTMFIRGYNLMEFSALGCVPLFASLLISVILFGCQPKAVKEVELLLLLISNAVCYVHSLNASQVWLRSLDGSLLTYHPSILLYPCLFVVTWVLSWDYNRRYKIYAETVESEVMPNEPSNVF